MPVTPSPRRLVLTLETVPWRPSPMGMTGFQARRHTCCAACSTEHNLIHSRAVFAAASGDPSAAAHIPPPPPAAAPVDRSVVPFPRRDRGPRSSPAALMDREAGMATAEYAIATLAAVAFAGLLAAVLGSGEVRSLLMGLIRSALSFG